MLDTVAVPEQFEPIFRKAQEYVSTYFSQKKEDASTGTIEVFGQRYILIRAASMSVDFFDTIKGMFKDWGEENASEMARTLLFDVAHTIGKMDARNFHQRMGLRDPIEKLSTGPIHFSYTGWAFVDISAESKPTPDENYYLLYDHPFSFEADAWEKSGKKSSSCVCTMNAGYSSGWCEESFGIPLVASEIMCKARGDSACRFIMAHPSKITQHLQAYLHSHPEIPDDAMLYRTGGFFQEFKQTQETLRKSEERFRTVFENTVVGLYRTTPDGRILLANPALVKMMGYQSFEELAQLSLEKEGIDSSTPRSVFKERIEKEGRVVGLESVWIRRDGTKLFVSESASAVRDSNGNILYYESTAEDITERRKAEEALRERESQLKTIIDNIQTGIFIIDPETHTIVDANPVAARLVGVQKNQLVGSNCHKYICPAEKGQCPITDLGQTVDNAERVLLTAKGEKRLIIKTVVTVTLGGRKHLLESFIDITERRKVEQALDKLNQDLQSTIDELSQSNKQLHDFVHIAAHDLKTPVRGIGTLADWIITDYGDKLDNQGREQVRLLKTRVIRIDKLIDGMLQFSKIVRTRHREKLVNLNAVLSDITGTIPPSDHVEIAVDSMPTIACEHDHIELVFQNLITNAVTFMDKTNGLVKVGCVEQGDFWKFYVSDNGPGIEQKYFEKIFRIFQTLPKKDEPETTGIGLAIVKKIVELYGGKIWVESQPGSGSTFYFTFPRAIEDISYAATKTSTAC